MEQNPYPPGYSLSTFHQVYAWACLLLDLALAIYVVMGLVRRERAGRILLDLGRIDENRLSQRIGFGAVQLVIGFLGVLLVGTGDFRWSYFTFVLLCGANTIVMSLQRFLVCEAGILSRARLQQSKLYRWDDILCYNLENGKLWLKLRDKGPLGERWMISPKVLLDYQDELDAVMASRCPRLKLPATV